MKKRLLITSIVMMLVVAVALSTATYAWFTQNATVEASSMTLKAGVSDAAALGIGWTGSGASTSITSNVYGASLKPMAPTGLSVGTTDEDVLFYTMTTKQEDGVFKFNADVTNENKVPPIVYNDNANDPVESFYVRNLSNANTISSVTVKAVFDEYMVLATNSAFEANVKYSTKSGSNYVDYDTTGLEVGDSITDANVYAYVPFVATKDTMAVAGTKYYRVKEGGTNEYEVVTGVTAGTTNVSTYYERVTADDMIRVALFTQEYRQATSYDGGATYYAYDPVDDVIKSAGGVTSSTPLDGYYTLSSAKHLLLGVLGKEDTDYVNVGSDAFDLNKVYFLRTGTVGNYTYTQTAYTASEYADEDLDKANVFTATSTAVYGNITADKAVNALSYYNNVKNEITLASNLKPGEQVDIVAYAWLDGTVLDDSRQGELGTVSLLFSAN